MKKILLTVLAVFITGCASVNAPNEKQARDVNTTFKSGNIPAAVAGIEQAFAKGDPKKPKDTTYYLEKGTIVRNLGQAKLQESSSLLYSADRVVQTWEKQTASNLAMNSSQFADSFVKAIKFDGVYQPRDYEKTMVSFSLAMNHALARRYDMVYSEANIMMKREDLIEKIREKELEAVKVKVDRSSGISSSIEDINGLDVKIDKSPEVLQLKNSYQNAAAYYLSGFLQESDPKEKAYADNFYKRAVQIKPNVQMFKDALQDVKVKSPNTAETLVVVESGFLSDVYSKKVKIPFATKSGPKIINFVIPENAKNGQFYNPKTVKIAQKSYPLSLAANVEAMSNKELNDQMPAYLVRATTSAVLQVAAQEIAMRSIDKNKDDKYAGLKKLAVAAAINAISAGDVDVRQWKSLPSGIFLARMTLPKGKSVIQIDTPVGPRSFPLTISENYEVVHLRVFNGGASLNNFVGKLSDEEYKAE